jgi:polyhydroxybutyrate depolymerase
MQIHGTADRGIPYEGGPIVGGLFEGQMLSVDATMSRWITANGCTSVGASQPLPDIDPTDGATATRITYGAGQNDTEVVLIRIDNGGHNWPGMPSTFHGPLTGVVCRDFDATQVIWEFFKTHPRNP